MIADDGVGDQRIIIFGRQHFLDVLAQSNTWFIDGTFSIAPRLFSQVYALLAERFVFLRGREYTDAEFRNGVYLQHRI